jgi:hypothetical protein
MLILSPRQRLAIATRGYAVVAIFCLALLALRLVAAGLSPTETLILSAILATPLALALFWEYIKGFKLGQVEITLAEVSLPIDIDLAVAVQEQHGSQTPALVQTIAAAIERRDFRFVQVNLHSSPYWWSTRLFLLAALADEYTDIERLVFVEQDAARIYLGMASPHAVRRALEQRFPDYKQKFRNVQDTVIAGNLPSRMQVENIGYGWSSSFLPNPEEQVRVLVTPTELREWLGEVLVTDARDWDGSPATRALYAKILTCRADYVPLLRGQRLEKVVSSNDLARRIAESALAQSTP